MFRIFHFLLIICLSATAVFALANPGGKGHRRIISGHIRNASNGESLIGATLFVKELGVGAISNSYGFYSISLVPGEYNLEYSFVGFKNLTKKIVLTENQVLKIELTPTNEVIEEVSITLNRKDKNITQIEMGVEKLQTKTIKSIPSLMGEVDLIKAIQLLPGVQSTSEGGSGFSVRGGSPDQNLILLDEAAVYNASHLMGFFSVFNNDVINDLKLYKGDVPAKYGGRLSSLLDVRMKDGNSKEFSGSGGIGLISSRLTLEGPIRNDNTTFIFSGRRTYMDLFLPLAKDKDVKGSRLYFYDANLKLTHRFNENNRLFLSSYFGRDVMKNPDFLMAFGNQTFTARWNHIFNQRLFMNLTTMWSRYDYALGTREGEPESWRWESDLRDTGLKLDFGYYISPGNSLKFGIQTYHHVFDPGVAKGVGSETVFGEFEIDKNNALEHAIYISQQQKLGDKIALKYGIRASLFQNIGEGMVYGYDENHEVTDSTFYPSGEVYQNYWGIEPRLGINYIINKNLSLKFNYIRTRQYIQQASNSMAGSPLDVWFSASPNVKPQISDQLALGAFRNMQGGVYQASIEAYYKTMQNTIDFADHANLLLNKYIEGELRVGDSKAFGVEMMIKKTEGKLTGWASYTLSRTELKIPEINNGKTFVSPYDKTHDFSLVVNYNLNERVSLSGNWIYTTGQPVTMPVQRYEINGSIIPFYSQRNGARYNDYHRLDLSLTLQSRKNRKRNWKGEWVFSIYNAYNRKNTWILNFIQDGKNPTQTYAQKTYLFPVIPSVSYNFRF